MNNLLSLTGQPLNVNAHLHTPYSFSAFGQLSEAPEMAKKEGVSVIGINDFYSFDGYAEWSIACEKHKLYPLFNIEFISLQSDDQAAGLRVNDPGNPGRTYLSGKGLAFPVKLSGKSAEALAAVRNASNAHVERMCGKLNELLAGINTGFALDFSRIEKELTKGNIRERHLARALYLEVRKKMNGNPAEMAAFFENIFGGKKLMSAVENAAAVENEIRGNLLRAGGAAFVPEEPKAFLPMDVVCNIILAAGGIPTYPFLADDAKGGFTDFEQDIKKAAETLKQRGIHSVEFITTRNSMKTLEEYAGYLHDEGFVVTFGSEHNTPAMEPVMLTVRGGEPLSQKLREINYAGACVVAAHQEAVKNGQAGYVDAQGKADATNREKWIKKGDGLIRKVVE